VWTNCLAAWVLAGAGFSRSESMSLSGLEWILGKLTHLFTLPMLVIPAAAASLLYVGGTALNDAFDAEYDREHRPERPIPSGALSLLSVWILGLGALLVGAGIFLHMGVTTGDVMLSALAIGLVALILIYDWMHKKSVWAVLPMGGCRLLLYLVVAAAAVQVRYVFAVEAQTFEEIAANGAASVALTTQQLVSVIAVGASLFVYMVVLTLSARAESGTEELKVSGKVALLLYLPAVVCIALVVWHQAAEPQILATLVAGTLFVVWTKSAITVLQSKVRDQSRIGIAVGRLLAGICLIDAMAAAAASTSIVPMLVCVGFFVLVLWLQRYVRST
jgi:hypothetical protein